MKLPIQSFSILGVLVSILVQSSTASYVISVPNGEEECFSIRIGTKSFISGSYDCLDDDVDGSQIKAIVKDEKTKDVKWTSSPQQTEGAFRVEVEPSRYSLCFSNDVSKEDEETTKDAANVGFSLRWIPPPRALQPDEEGPEAQRALKLVGSASVIDQDWQNLLDHYDFLRNREGVHTELIQGIFGRLLRWTIIEAVLVILMAVAQVMYLRKFFEQRRYL